MFNLYAQSFVRLRQWVSATTAMLLLFTAGQGLAQSYCTSAAQFSDDGVIASVTLGGATNATACAVEAGGAGSLANRYSNFTTVGTPASVIQGSSLPFSVTMSSCSPFAYEYAFRIYADWNNNGSFTDFGETVFTSATSEVSSDDPVVVTGNIAVPGFSFVGNVRLRIVMIEQPGAFNSCGSYLYGETEDHHINVTSSGDCAGTPAVTATLADNLTPTGATLVTLSLQNIPSGGGYTYQWQSSSNGTTWTNITGANSFSYVTGVPFQTFFRCLITCTFSNETVNSTPLQIVPAPLTIANYCAPPIASSTADEEIFNVTFGTINNSTGCNLGTQYGLFTPACPPTFVAGQTYPLSLTLGMNNTFSSFSGHAEVMIDFNRNGVFDLPAERVFRWPAAAGTSANPNTLPGWVQGCGGGAVVTGNILVPATAQQGNMLMRVLYFEIGTDFTGCAPTPSPWGDTEDYFISVVANESTCTGVPANIVATVSQANGCIGNNVSFSLQGCPGSALQYQWQLSADGSTNWVNAVGATATSSSFNTTASAGTFGFYRCVVTCGTTNETSISSVVQFAQNPPLSCFCSSTATTIADEEIFNVSIGGLNNASTCTTVAPGPNSVASLYSNYTTLTPTTLIHGETFPLSLTLGMCGTFAFSGHAEVFIDFNNNGVWDLPAERVFRWPAASGATFAPNPVTGQVVSGLVTIPSTAASANVLMRVMYFETGVDFNGCGTPNIFGETEDYVVQLAAPTACSSLPATVTAATNKPLGCIGETFSFNITGVVPGTIYGLQWQYSADGSTNWTNITGANSAFYTLTVNSSSQFGYYRARVTCPAATGEVFSSAAQITQNTPLNCFCAPSVPVSNFYDKIFNISVGSFSNNSLCGDVAPGPNSIADRYSNYTTLAPINLVKGTAVPVSISIGDCLASFNTPGHTEILIDLNGNGIWDFPQERVFRDPATGTNDAPNLGLPALVSTGGFSIPANANSTNPVLMRVIRANTAVEFTGCAGQALTYGEVEDYRVQFTDPAPCATLPATITASTNVTSGCIGTGVVLTITGLASGTLYNTQWQYSSNGVTFADVAGANNLIYTFNASTSSLFGYYRAVVSCPAATGEVVSNAVQISQNPPLSCFCPSAATATADEEIFNVTFGAINTTSTCTTVAPGPGSVASLYSNYTTATPATQFSPGQSYPVSLTLGMCGTFAFSGHAEVFIDFNNNGAWEPATERAFRFPAASGTTFAPNPVTGQVVTGNINIPAGATPGNVLMRVMYYETGTDFNGCGTPSSWGETEDYLISIVPPPPCAALPTTATLSSSVSGSVCAGTPVNLSIAGLGLNSFTIVWQRSTDGVNFAPIAGAASTAGYSFTPTSASDFGFFRAVISCPADPAAGSVTTNAVQVSQTPFFGCFCASAATLPDDEEIFNVTIGELNSTSTCATTAPGPGSVASLYSSYIGYATVPELNVGSTVPISLTLGMCGTFPYSGHAEVYIDWNKNGIWEPATERVFRWPAASGSTFAPNPVTGQVVTGSITVPANAATGGTLMRVMYYETGVDFNGCGTPSPWGETEDYQVNVVIPPPCTVAPDLTISATPAGYCLGVGNNISFTSSAAPNQSGYTYQWQSSTDGGQTWSDISGATSKNYTAFMNADAQYRLASSCGSSVAYSNVINIQGNTPPNAGTVTGPTTGLTNVNGLFEVTGATSVQWQASLDGINYFDVVGATAPQINLFSSFAATYYIRNRAAGNGCTDAFSNAVIWVISLGNDNVCGPLPALAVGQSDPFTNVGSTTQAGEPFPPFGGCNTDSTWCQVPGSNSVWFTFTPPQDGRYTFLVQAITVGGSPNPALINSQIAIWQAASCTAVTTPGGRTLIAANDDGSGTSAQVSENCMIGGTTYYVQVDGSGTLTGNFRFQISFNGAPDIVGLPNEACGQDPNPINLTGTPAGGTFSGPGVLEGTNLFYPALADDGVHVITYQVSCFTVTKTVTVFSNDFYIDLDADGFGDDTNPNFPSVLGCLSLPGYVLNDTDCNDGSASTNPNGVEVCDGLDNNCNGLFDEGVLITFYRDQDFDGYGVNDDTVLACSSVAGYVPLGGDCNDSNPTINPGVSEICNAIDDDCDGVVDNGFPYLNWYVDVDNDGFGVTSTLVSFCQAPGSQWVNLDGDCNDNNTAIRPNAVEVCDGIDNNCNGLIDGNDPAVAGQATWYLDADGDGFGTPNTFVLSCSQPSGYVSSFTDCNDFNAAINPNAVEIIGDGINNDCDGMTDETCDMPNNLQVSNITDVSAVMTWNPIPAAFSYRIQYRKLGSAFTTIAIVSAPNTTFNNPQLQPLTGYQWRMRTHCGVAGNTTPTPWTPWQTFFTNQKLYVDADGDGFGSTTVIFGQGPGNGASLTNNDCNDNNAAINPGTAEVCNQIDDNCNNMVDDGFPFSAVFMDADGDGFGNPSVSVQACGAYGSYVGNNGDCDDANMNVNPEATEICNQIDDNCDGVVDFCDQPTGLAISNIGVNAAAASWNASQCVTGYRVRYRINYGNGVFSSFVTLNLPASQTTFQLSNLQSLERYQFGVAGRCANGSLTTYLTTSFVTFDTIYLDLDGDGFGDPSTAFLNDSIGSNQSLVAFDCNDNDENTFPGAAELCDGLDNNCNVDVDENLTFIPYYQDLDADGFGGAFVNDFCIAQPGMVTNDFDCIDNNSLVNPNGVEVCNEIDDNCNGIVDEGVQTVFYADVDGDGFGNANNTTMACSVPAGYVTNTEDCNDNNAAVPNANNCVTPTNTFETNITTNSATLHWTAPNCEKNFLLQYRPQNQQTIAWTWVPLDDVTSTSYTAMFLNPGRLYLWRVRSVCAGGANSSQASDQFTTLSGSALQMNETGMGETDFVVYPNPTRDYLNVVIGGEAEEFATMTVSDQLGRTLISVSDYVTGGSPFALEVSELPEGAYMITVQRGSQISAQRFMKN
jgi:hypothetical protein